MAKRSTRTRQSLILYFILFCDAMLCNPLTSLTLLRMPLMHLLAADNNHNHKQSRSQGGGYQQPEQHMYGEPQPLGPGGPDQGPGPGRYGGGTGYSSDGAGSGGFGEARGGGGGGVSVGGIRILPPQQNTMRSMSGGGGGRGDRRDHARGGPGPGPGPGSQAPHYPHQPLGSPYFGGSTEGAVSATLGMTGGPGYKFGEVAPSLPMYHPPHQGGWYGNEMDFPPSGHGGPQGFGPGPGNFGGPMGPPMGEYVAFSEQGKTRPSYHLDDGCSALTLNCVALIEIRNSNARVTKFSKTWQALFLFIEWSSHLTFFIFYCTDSSFSATLNE
jgi:hypothetical protein